MDLGIAITSKSNVRVKELRSSFGGSAREPGEIVGLEGEHLISEALRTGVHFDTVFVREGSEGVLERPLLEGLQAKSWAMLGRDAFASAVDTASPQGIAATVAIPVMKSAEAVGVVLVLEDLQDPGNLGTLIRSAEAFGVSHVFVSPATVSAWNPKVVRASAGSVFRISVTRMSIRETKRWLNERSVKLSAAVARSVDAVSSVEAKLVAPCALMIGNEGAGLSYEALSLADERLHIPCAVESLNAAIAGSVLLYEALRQSAGRKDAVR